MRNHTGRVFERLLSLLLPARGQHRAAAMNPAVSCADAPTMSSRWVPDPYVWRSMRDEDAYLARPYAVAHECAAARRRECGSRTGPAGAAHGRTVTL